MLNIRPYQKTDLARILAITLQAWVPVFESFKTLLGDTVFDIVYPEWQEEKRRQLISQCGGDHGETIRIAELDGTVVGYAVYYCNTKTGIGEISHNAVDPTYQNQGIATKLYRYCLEDMKNRGMTCANVSTGGDPSHAPARRAYEKAGFNRSIPSVHYYKKL